MRNDISKYPLNHTNSCRHRHLMYARRYKLNHRLGKNLVDTINDDVDTNLSVSTDILICYSSYHSTYNILISDTTGQYLLIMVHA